MSKLISNNNYLLTVDNFSAPNKIRKIFNKHYKFIKRNENKLIFTNDKIKITLWSNHRSDEKYICYITLEKNNNYRLTKYELNSKSIYIWITIHPIKLTYLTTFSSITTLEKFLFIVDFYNKQNVKKNLKRVHVITKLFQDYYLTRYISEFL